MQSSHTTLRNYIYLVALDEDSGDVVWSNRFGDQQRGLWRLKVYPYGDGSPNGRTHVSVFLALDYAAMKQPKVYAIFSCSVLDKDGEKIQASGRSFTRQKFAEGTASWGWSQFIRVEGQNLNSLLVNDSLTLKCTIDVFLGVRPAAGVSAPVPMSLTEDVSAFWQSESGRDVEFVLHDTESFTVHKSMMAARSRVLRKIFYMHKKEINGDDDGASASAKTTDDAEPTSSVAPPTDLDSLEIPPGIASGGKRRVLITNEDISVFAFKELLQYLRTDDCPLMRASCAPLPDLLDVLMCSCILDVPSLRAACVGRLMSRVTSRNDAVLILTVAEKCRCTELAQQAKNFLQYCTSDLQGEELLKLLMPGVTTKTPSPLHH